MKKMYLLLVTCLIMFSCSKDIGDVSSDSLSENKLTEEEAIVVANHLMGKAITPTEALSEAEALIAFLD